MFLTLFNFCFVENDRDVAYQECIVFLIDIRQPEATSNDVAFEMYLDPMSPDPADCIHATDEKGEK